MTYVLAIQSDQTKAGSAGAGPAPWRVERCRPTFDHFQFHPEGTPSSPAGGRSLMGGCAIRRQTRPQGSADALKAYRAIRSSRRLILGWTGDLNAIADVRRLTLSGIDERLAALLVADQPGNQLAVQAIADLPEVHPSVLASARSTNASTPTRKRFADEQNPCVSGAKID